MASPHASSFICLPFVDHPDVVLAYTVYFSVCIGSALIGVAGALLFLSQVMRGASESTYQSSSATSQRRILILLAVSDLFADIGEPQRTAGVAAILSLDGQTFCLVRETTASIGYL